MMLRLGVNIDHVATLRNARGGIHPDPVDAALLAQQAGADSITAHLREDRRHIRDADMFALKDRLAIPLNFEMAATEEMQKLALDILPHAVCLVPEKREEITTEGGLDVLAAKEKLSDFIAPLSAAGIRVSCFVDPYRAQILASLEAGAQAVELHTGHYCAASSAEREQLFFMIEDAAYYTDSLGLECHAGHGLDYDTAADMARIAPLRELNIGHFLIGEAVLIGLEAAIKRMREAMLHPSLYSPLASQAE